MNDKAAAARMAEIKAGLGETWFAWSGPTEAAPGKNGASYYRIQGPNLVIEYAPQGAGGAPSMHIHTIYRDPMNDYGRKPAAMKPGLVAVLLLTGGTAFGHRLDEYLQATTIAIEKDRVQVEMRLTPGVAVFPSVMAIVDTCLPPDGGAFPNRASPGLRIHHRPRRREPAVFRYRAGVHGSGGAGDCRPRGIRRAAGFLGRAFRAPSAVK